jgi:DNA-binding MarR family transcriptional regulator
MSKPENHATPVEPTRVRSLPAHFAWADHRLRDRLATLTLEEIALLFFLHLAADKTGCSFWADSTIAKRLGVREGDIVAARVELVRKGFVAYRYPLYQILPIVEDAA